MLGLKVHNRFMTITYANGTILKAIVLANEEHMIRAIAAGSDDVLAFTHISGTWVSEELEPVDIEFEWQRCGAALVLSEDDCVCSQKLAAHLVQTLFAGSEAQIAGEEPLYLSSPEGICVAIHQIC